MIGDTENILELVRTMPSSVCLLLIVPIILITAPTVVAGSQDFPVFRMQQYDFAGVKYGSRSALINLEARSLSAENLIRRCAVVKIKQLDTNQLKTAITNGLSGLLILLPSDLDSVVAEGGEDLLAFQQLEEELLDAELPIPVYFAYENEEMSQLYDDVGAALNSDSAKSAVKALSSVALINSFHFLTDGGESKALNDFQVVSLQGKLVGDGAEDQLPTIAIVTHYDSFSISPMLSMGADASASGTTAFLEMARLFSKLYERSATKPKYNILFLLAGGGKFNFQGTKKWIEEGIESSEISLLSEVDYVLCIDGVGQGTNLNMHVSKPPKEGSHGFQLLQDLKGIASALYPDTQVNLVHKKVNLADDMLSWEHERFSLRRLPAGTLSHHSQPSKLSRGSLFDRAMDLDVLLRNIKIISEGVARHVYNLTGKGFRTDMQVFTDDLDVDKQKVRTWSEHLTSQPRAQQLITRDSKLLLGFEETMLKYLKDVKRVTAKAEKKEPEFVFYDIYKSKMSVYSVKPALFDLFLAVGIGLYLGAVYLLVENFNIFSDIMPKPVQNGKAYHSD